MALLHADVVIVGGSGFIGRALAATLISRGKSVRVITRSRERARELWLLPRIEIVQANPNDEAALYDAFENADAVVNLVGVLHSKGGKPWGADFDSAHVKLPARIARCSRYRRPSCRRNCCATPRDRPSSPRRPTANGSSSAPAGVVVGTHGSPRPLSVLTPVNVAFWPVFAPPTLARPEA